MLAYTECTGSGSHAGQVRVVRPRRFRYDIGMFEHFEHTADLGLRVRAADLNTLFAEAAEALFVAIVEDAESIQTLRKFEFRIAGTDLAYLLFDWLKELLYRFDAEHQLQRGFEVKVG